MLITRRALSSLEPTQQLQHKKHQDSSNSSTTSDTFAPEDSSSISDSSSIESSASEAESSIDWEDVQAHKRAAVQQAFLNDSLGFGFSAGGLVFPYYGEQHACMHKEAAVSYQNNTFKPAVVALLVLVLAVQC